MLALRPLQRLPLSQLPRVQAARMAEVPLRRPKLIILGVGWAGYKIAKDIDTRLWEVNVISPRNYFLFTPLLTTTTVGTLEFRCIAEPIRQLRGDINYVQAEATSLDLANKRVHCKHAYVETSEEGQITTPEFSMRYDHLVIACGKPSPHLLGFDTDCISCAFSKILHSSTQPLRKQTLTFCYQSHLT